VIAREDETTSPVILEDSRKSIYLLRLTDFTVILSKGVMRFNITREEQRSIIGRLLRDHLADTSSEEIGTHDEVSDESRKN
jgi:hypothetical protein